ncbi:hypothetical protein CTI12_AA270070 [Artemisia annua]|uniref:Uncharacterized protein n=1 Tax=Artemisia annua TaxID=35608 RepID=A0A2U1NG41_ARTAN|nr:hypothetical protein CTI12_AA270070 [Artemisia annua]
MGASTIVVDVRITIVKWHFTSKLIKKFTKTSSCNVLHSQRLLDQFTDFSDEVLQTKATTVAPMDIAAITHPGLVDFGTRKD